MGSTGRGVVCVLLGSGGVARVLITSTRMPFAIDAIRKLGATGHRVFASDTFATAPGNHSRYVEEAFVTPSPTFATEAFVRAIEAIVARCVIDVILPSFEEALYLAAYRDRLEPQTELFTPPLETLLVVTACGGNTSWHHLIQRAARYARREGFY